MRQHFPGAWRGERSSCALPTAPTRSALVPYQGEQHRWSSNRVRLVHGCLIADFTASRLGGGGPAARIAHARACTTRHAARHRFAGWCGISGRQRSRRFRRDVGSAFGSANATSAPGVHQAMACVALPRVANQLGGANAGGQGEVHRCFRLRPRLARRYVHVHSVAMWLGARRFRGAWRARGAWRRGERRSAAVGGVALAPMRPRRARCIIASSSGRGGVIALNSCRWKTCDGRFMARRDGGAACNAVALRSGGGQARAVAPRGHAAPYADASTLTPKAL